MPRQHLAERDGGPVVQRSPAALKELAATFTEIAVVKPWGFLELLPQLRRMISI